MRVHTMHDTHVHAYILLDALPEASSGECECAGREQASSQPDVLQR